MCIVIFAVLFCLCCSAGCTSDHPNFVLVLTDDQDLHLDGLVPMQKTLKLVANQGVVFENAFVNTPICCPSRSSLLTGKYAHNIKVFNNSISGNCSSSEWQQKNEPFSIAAILKDEANYNTFYAGKYLNQYGSKEANGITHIPAGYDWWLGLQGNSKYYNYTLSVNGTGRFFQNEYLTDKIKEYALDFLSQGHVKHHQFLMILSPPAPHAPFTPAERHKNRFPNAKVIRNAAFNSTPIEKHWLVRMAPTSLPSNVTILDSIQRRRQQTLLAVDELVDSVVLKLNETGVLNNTYVIFTSDNGFHIGQFTQPWDKRQPYQSDINVPLMISGPKVLKKKLSKYPVSTVDLAPTLLDLANVRIPKDMDGVSFKNELFYLNGSQVSRQILVEYWGEGSARTNDPDCPWPDPYSLAECTAGNWCKCQDSRNNTYSCVLDISLGVPVFFKVCKFEDSEHFYEAYDLLGDPFELKNIYRDLSPSHQKHYTHMLKIQNSFN